MPGLSQARLPPAKTPAKAIFCFSLPSFLSVLSLFSSSFLFLSLFIASLTFCPSFALPLLLSLSAHRGSPNCCPFGSQGEARGEPGCLVVVKVAPGALGPPWVQLRQRRGCPITLYLDQEGVAISLKDLIGNRLCKSGTQPQIYE